MLIDVNIVRSKFLFGIIICIVPLLLVPLLNNVFLSLTFFPTVYIAFHLVTAIRNRNGRQFVRGVVPAFLLDIFQVSSVKPKETAIPQTLDEVLNENVPAYSNIVTPAIKEEIDKIEVDEDLTLKEKEIFKFLKKHQVSYLGHYPVKEFKLSYYNDLVNRTPRYYFRFFRKRDFVPNQKVKDNYKLFLAALFVEAVMRQKKFETNEKLKTFHSNIIENLKRDEKDLSRIVDREITID